MTQHARMAWVPATGYTRGSKLILWASKAIALLDPGIQNTNFLTTDSLRNISLGIMENYKIHQRLSKACFLVLTVWGESKKSGIKKNF